MSESFATSRPSPGAEEFERRIRALAASPDLQDGPLAELARLVGENDPFRSAKPQIRATVARPEPVSASPVIQSIGGYRRDVSSFDDEFKGALDAGEEPGAPDDPAIVHAAAGTRPTLAPTYAPRAPEVSPDTWARGGDPMIPMLDPAGPAANRNGQGPDGGGSKRTLIVLAAVVVLTGGGLAASFLAKPSNTVSAAAPSSSVTPTILAATGPSKVAPPETPAADAPSEPSTLLDKNKNDGTASAKVVNSDEQPVDLNQAVKPLQTAQASDGATVAASAFPQPRKVKTVLVRPDGSIITDRPPTASAAQDVSPNQDSIAFDPKTSLPTPPSQPSAAAVPDSPPAPDAATPVPAASTPAAIAAGKSQARVAVTPRATGTTTGSPSVTQGHAVATTPKPKPAAPPKPAETADAAPPAAEAPATVLPAGTFAAQLGAGGSEAEANGLQATLARRYASVAGRLSIHKAQSGTKTVYRVRVSGLSQEAAKGVCSKVTAAGGGCFVARD